MASPFVRTALSVAALSLIVTSLPASGDDANIGLHKVDGTVSYQVGTTAPVPLAGDQLVSGGTTAITADGSHGIVKLPDSSQVGLGPNTRVLVGAFERSAANGDGSTITVPVGSGATVRFDIKRPQGGKSNYRFVTPTSSVAVRGTTGLLSSGPNGDQIACLQCDVNDVEVTVGTKVYPLVTGQVLTVTIAGVVTIGVISALVISAFSGAGLSTAATAASPVAGAGAAGAAGAAGGAAGAGAAGAAGAAAAAASGIAAAAAAVGIGVISSVAAKIQANPPPRLPTPNPSFTPIPPGTPLPTTAPTTAPSPGPTQTGVGTIQSRPRGPK